MVTAFVYVSDTGKMLTAYELPRGRVENDFYRWNLNGRDLQLLKIEVNPWRIIRILDNGALITDHQGNMVWDYLGETWTFFNYT